MNPVQNYLSTFPKDVQELLEQVRHIIANAAPEADESISYGMTAYKLSGKPLVYFAGYKKHIGLYALPSGQEVFAEELDKYKKGKGSVQFPINEPLPLDLIERMVKFRKEEDLNK
jgi:uncharacterized protein YdhG (YjbR/CyaY superfamily)